jgi:hypothetical protein
MLCEPTIQITGLADIAALGGNALNYIYMECHNSPSRARTYNLAVNSRSLYQLSYRGIPMKRFGLALCVPTTIFVHSVARYYSNSYGFVKHFFFYGYYEKSDWPVVLHFLPDGVLLMLDEDGILLYTSGFGKLSKLVYGSI